MLPKAQSHDPFIHLPWRVIIGSVSIVVLVLLLAALAIAQSKTAADGVNSTQSSATPAWAQYTPDVGN